jgi:peptidoglycan/LPS O-acetylase OafA/YrhL
MAVLITPQDFRFYVQSLYAAVTFSSNQYFAGFGDYFAPNAHELPLLHTWSLGIEMQFYLVLPILIAITPDRYRRIFFPALTLLAVSTSGYAAYLTYREGTYFAFVTRVPEFLIGTCLAGFGVKNGWSVRLSNCVAWVGLGLCSAGFTLANKMTAFAGLVSLVTCLGAAMIIATPRSALGWLWSLPALVRVGDLSYSLYLWHWPVLVGLRYYGERYSLSPVQIVIFAILVAALSWWSYRYVEAPFRRGVSLREELRRFAIGAALVVVVMFAAVQVNRSIVPHLPIAWTRFAAPESICNDRMLDSCYRGDLAGKKEVLVVGDSHAAQLNYFFDAVGKQNRFRARIITANGCINIQGFDFARLREYAKPICASQTDAARRYLDEADVVVVAGLWDYHAHSAAFMESFDRFLSMLDVNKKEVIVMAQVPMLSANVLRVYRFKQLGLPVNVSKSDGWDAGNLKVLAIVRKHPNVRFLDFSKIDLFAQAPFYGNELIYYDSNHLNEIGSYRFGEAVAEHFVLAP